MEGGHRVEDDPLVPLNRLDSFHQQQQFENPHQVPLDQWARLDHIARPSLDSSHSVSPQPKPDRLLDAPLKLPTVASSSHHPQSTHQTYFTHLVHQGHYGQFENLQTHHQPSVVSHALQPSPLPAFKDQSSPATVHAASGPSRYSSASNTSQSQPFPPFPSFDTFGPNELHNPGAFYRSYTDDSLRRQYRPHLEAAAALPAADQMAPEAPVSRSPLPASSFPSIDKPNGLPGQNLQHVQQQARSRPPPSLSNRSNAIRSTRSVSSPVENNSSSTASTYRTGFGTARSSSTSVKDLKKRFDQINGGQTNSAGSFSTSISASSRLRPTAGIDLPSSPSASSTTASRSRASTADTTSTKGAASPSRAKSPTGHSQLPPPLSSPKSFASRIVKPRVGVPATYSVSANEQASRSMSNLTLPLAPPRAAWMESPPPPPPMIRANSFFFGSALPAYNSSLAIGDNIDAVIARPRRTSFDSILHSPSTIFPRSRSEMKQNSEAVLPTDWYSNTTTPHTAANHDAPVSQPTAASSSTSRLPTGHIRAHSDLADTKPVYRDRYLHRNSQHNVSKTLPPTQSHFVTRARLDGQQTANSSSRQSTFIPDMPQFPSSPTSRLPMSVRKLSVTSGRSSPSSTRSDSSVSAAERRSAAAIRASRQQQPQPPPKSSANAKASTRRAATPTSTPAMRTKAPGTTPTSSHRPPLSQTSSKNSRVSAFNATPQPTPLPTLRGSQTRQPALPATTSSSSASRYGRTSEASLSSSAAGRTRLPGPGNSRSSTIKQDEGRASRRKIDVGPIDFAQRRETIRLKYSKSIRDTEASAARQAAAERRKKELEAAAKAKALAEAAVRAQSEAGRRAMGASAIALSTKSSASSLSAMSNAAVGASTAPSLAAAARSVSVRSSTAPNAANMDVTAVSLPSPTSALPGNSTTPQPLSTVAAGAAGVCAAVSSGPQSSAHQALQPSPSLARKISLQNAALEPSALTLSIPAPEPKPDCEWVPQDGDSPTLGLPGTYPGGFNSPPPIENDELPPPAVSLDTVTSMPDKGLQTDPPRQDVTGKLQGGEYTQQSKQLEDQQQLQEQAQSEYAGFVHEGHHKSSDLTTSEAAPVQPSHQDVHSVSKVQGTFFIQDRRPSGVATTANSKDAGRSRDASLSPFEQYLPGSYRQDSFESRPQTPPQQQFSSHEPEHLSAISNQTPRPKRELRHMSSYQHIRRSATDDVTTDLRVGASTLYGPVNMDGNDAAIGLAVSSISPSDEDNHLELASRNVEAEYEVQPFRTDDCDVKTTVTILGRETDVPSRQPSLSRLNNSSIRRGIANESGSDSGEVSYDSWIHDNIATLPEPTFSASGLSDEPPQTERSARQPHRTPEMSNGLNLPSIMSPANRLSQQSGWTDFSIESEDARAFLALRAATATLPHEDSSIDHNATLRARISPLSHLQNQQILQQRGRRRELYDSSSRPAWTDDDKEQVRQDDSYAGVYVSDPPDSESILRSGKEPITTMLPQLDTETDFFIPYLTDDNVTGPHIPVLPDHDPPPIPVSFDGRDSFTENSIRPSSSSAYYDSSRPNSFALGQDGQDSFTFGDTGSADESMLTSPPPTVAIQSSEQALLDLPMQSISGLTLINSERPSGLDGTADACDDDALHSQPSASFEKTGGSKEQSRLVQRQMVIRELIDTESVFVRDMNIVEEIYKGTAEACPQLDSNTVKLIFRNTDEIIAFHTAFLVQLKDAVSSVYVPKGGRRSSPLLREDSIRSDSGTLNSVSAESVTGTTVSSSSTAAATTTASISEDARDRQTCLGPAFHQNIDQLRITHEAFLRSSDSAAKRLIQIQEDPTVKLWLTECNEVAQDLTAAWNLDSLLIKPMQRITKYPNLISQLLQYTPEDHPDRPSLISARTTLENAILEINQTKKNFELVGQIVGRKRKDSDVRAGFARAFGKRVDKLQVSSNRTPEDQVYAKLNEKFADDYLRLQVVLRDVEFYTRQVSAYVHEFLQLLSAMELVMRLQPSPYPELESKWASFNVSMRDMEKVALEQHLAQVRKQVIEPFEMVIKCYGNPSLAMKKRAKRRLDYERAAQLKKGGKKIDKQLAELVEQYDALNEALKKELPMLSANTKKIGNICLGNFVNIQIRWFAIWKEKVKVVLEDQQSVPEVSDILSCFTRDFKDVEEYVKQSLTFLTKGAKSMDLGSPPPGGIGMLRTRSGRPSDTISPRTRCESVNSDSAPTLPAPDFGGRSSGQFAFSSTTTVTPPGAGTSLGLGPSASIASATSVVSSPQQVYYRDDYYSGLSPNNGSVRGSSRSSIAPEMTAEPASMRSNGSANASHSGFFAGMNVSGRPSTGRSHDSSGNTAPRPSIDSLTQGLPATGQSSMAAVLQASQRESASTHNTVNQLPPSSTASGDSSTFTGSFGSGARRPSVKLDDNLSSTVDTSARTDPSKNSLPADNASQLASRAPSRERVSATLSYASSTTSGNANASGYKVLWLAASLFEFNIETKHEAGYPYLTYQEGEIFDVIAEKGELWLAKNQDDPTELLGWIWSKHFAKLADS